ncbi:MAG: EamA family transporter [Clostridia bacterium]|nr:EamA family transporter [Clostridia bacterium]
MKYLIVLLLCILAVTKLSIQGAFGKKNVKNSSDALVFNGVVFVVAALLFSPSVFGCSPAVWLYALPASIFTVAYQVFYTKALTMGSVSLTVLIANFAMVLNVLVSYFFFGDSMSPIRLSGIVITVISFIICTDFKKTQKKTQKWLLMAVLSLFTSSAGSVVSKFFGESPYKNESAAYVSCLYIVSAVLVCIIYLIMHVKGKKITFSKGPLNVIKYALGVGISLALYQLIYTTALGKMDGTFLFPAITGSTILLSTFSGVLLFKDMLPKRQIVGIVLGIIAVVLMNF